MKRTLDTLTIGEFRALMHYGGAEAETVSEALDNMAAADRAQAAHNVEWAAYTRYVATRERRRAAAMEAAAVEASQAARGSDGAKMAARREARTDVYNAFETSEPLLGFGAWQQAGGPETFTRGGAVKRAATAVREALVS